MGFSPEVSEIEHPRENQLPLHASFVPLVSCHSNFVISSSLLPFFFSSSTPATSGGFSSSFAGDWNFFIIILGSQLSASGFFSCCVLCSHFSLLSISYFFVLHLIFSILHLCSQFSLLFVLHLCSLFLVQDIYKCNYM